MSLRRLRIGLGSVVVFSLPCEVLAGLAVAVSARLALQGVLCRRRGMGIAAFLDSWWDCGRPEIGCNGSVSPWAGILGLQIRFQPLQRFGDAQVCQGLKSCKCM